MGPDGFYAVRREAVDAAKIRALVDDAKTNLVRSSAAWSVAEQSGFLMFKRPSLLSATVEPALSELARAALTQDRVVPGLTMRLAGTLVPDDRCCERILDAAFLQEAAKLLRKPGLLAIIPKRGWLAVAACEPGELPHMMRMAQAASGVFSRAGDLAISATGFFARDGQLTGFNAMDGTSGTLSLVGPSEQAWLEPA
jgi:hypothetical protein